MSIAVSYRKVNAFTGAESDGNPAAYLELGDVELSPEQMLSVGREHAGFVSEVVFVSNTPYADCKLTYYSSQCEVEFCGHGTIATMYDLICRTPELQAQKRITIETNCKGRIEIFNRIESEDAIYIAAPEQKEFPLPIDAVEAANILGINEDTIDSAYPMDYIEAGLRTLVVPLKTLKDVVSTWPDERAMREFNERYGIEDFLIYSTETESAEHIAHTRVFAPKFGYLEDPATGSANSAFARYMLKNKLWNGTPTSLEQGGEDRVFNTVKIICKDDKIFFGGHSTTKIDGLYYL